MNSDEQTTPSNAYSNRPGLRHRSFKRAWLVAAASGVAVAAVPMGANAQSGLAALGPGDVFTHCEIFCPEMALIPGGEFRMGSPEDEFGREPDEGPTRGVAIAPFAIAITEVTFNQWDACVADGFCRRIEEDLGWGKGRGRRPAIGVSWRDVVGARREGDDGAPLPPDDGFLAWINSKVSGSPYRLPTEAEWEYAARAGAQAPHHTGERITVAEANFNPDFSKDPRPSAGGRYRGKTVPVGSLPPNGFGLFETAGNVWEWVQDCYRPSYRGAPIDGSAVEEPDCQKRVLRGGGYQAFEIGVRAANRYSFDPEARLGAFGVRVAFDLEEAGYRCDADLNCTPTR
ncbi:MAG: formylglycine-generating enzyme family protein [Pseudomonadota bacterium]